MKRPLSFLSGLCLLLFVQSGVTNPAAAQTPIAGPTAIIGSWSGIPCGGTLLTADDPLFYVAVAGATNYRYEVNGTDTVERGFALNQWCLCSYPSLQYGTTYSIRVSAFVGGVWQPFGTACSITTPAVPVTTNLIPAFCPGTLAGWGDPAGFACICGADSYRIRINGLDTFDIPWYCCDVWMRNYAGVAQNTTYSVEIAPIVEGVRYAYGAACNLTTPNVPFMKMDVTELVNYGEPSHPDQLAISVFPNPATEGLLTVELTGDIHDELTAELVDLNGRLVFMEPWGSYTGNSLQRLIRIGSDIPKGVYFLRIGHGNSLLTKKLVIQ